MFAARNAARARSGEPSRLGMSVDVLARTAIWLAVVALWGSLNKPDDGGLLLVWAGGGRVP